VVRPIATTETLGAFLNGLRIVVIDGTCFDVPDSDENARVFGRPSSRPGTQALRVRQFPTAGNPPSGLDSPHSQKSD
jgi:hypothetical protein